MAQKLDFDSTAEINIDDIREGVDYICEFTATDPDDDPYDFTGCTITITFKDEVDTSNADIVFSTTSGEITIDGETVTWNILDTKTAGKYRKYNYTWGIEIIDADGFKMYPVHGKAKIRNKV